jgi:hypothetical protein
MTRHAASGPLERDQRDLRGAIPVVLNGIVVTILVVPVAIPTVQGAMHLRADERPVVCDDLQSLGEHGIGHRPQAVGMLAEPPSRQHRIGSRHRGQRFMGDPIAACRLTLGECRNLFGGQLHVPQFHLQSHAFPDRGSPSTGCGVPTASSSPWTKSPHIATATSQAYAEHRAV